MKEVKGLFSIEEINSINEELKNFPWEFTGGTDYSRGTFLPQFWFKGLLNSSINFLFKEKLEKLFSRPVLIQRIYVNGQAHGQCGYWHSDYPPSDIDRNTLVYFIKEWEPEYGGHLLIKRNDEVYSFLPRFNYGVVFDGSLLHMGMEPTVFCKTQRESIACKFILE